VERLDGKVALITGIARGQGRAHAVRLAREGADIVGIDICADIASLNIPNATLADLDETKRLVEAEGRRVLVRQGDVRDFAALTDLVEETVSSFGRLDIVVANAGVVRLGTEDDPIAEWADIIGVNLTGAFHTVKAAVPAIIDGGRGGSIVMTGSTAAVRGASSAVAGGLAYTASKRGITGLVQLLAKDLAKHWIRVNAIHPTGVATKMLLNSAMRDWFESGAASGMQNALPVAVLQPEDIANAVAWLVSDEAKYVTGVQLPVDAGFNIR
jgi:SDR family mycofactocin-dependent oxidoreductase